MEALAASFGSVPSFSRPARQGLDEEVPQPGLLIRSQPVVDDRGEADQPQRVVDPGLELRRRAPRIGEGRIELIQKPGRPDPDQTHAAIEAAGSTANELGAALILVTLSQSGEEAADAHRWNNILSSRYPDLVIRHETHPEPLIDALREVAAEVDLIVMPMRDQSRARSGKTSCVRPACRSCWCAIATMISRTTTARRKIRRPQPAEPGSLPGGA